MCIKVTVHEFTFAKPLTKEKSLITVFSGVKDTAKKFSTGIKDTAEDFLAVSLTPAQNF